MEKKRLYEADVTYWNGTRETMETKTVHIAASSFGEAVDHLREKEKYHGVKSVHEESESIEIV